MMTDVNALKQQEALSRLQNYVQSELSPLVTTAAADTQSRQEKLMKLVAKFVLSLSTCNFVSPAVTRAAFAVILLIIIIIITRGLITKNILQ